MKWMMMAVTAAAMAAGVYAQAAEEDVLGVNSWVGVHVGIDAGSKTFPSKASYKIHTRVGNTDFCTGAVCAGYSSNRAYGPKPCRGLLVRGVDGAGIFHFSLAYKGKKGEEDLMPLIVAKAREWDKVAKANDIASVCKFMVDFMGPPRTDGSGSAYCQVFYTYGDLGGKAPVCGRVSFSWQSAEIDVLCHPYVTATMTDRAAALRLGEQEYAVTNIAVEDLAAMCDPAAYEPMRAEAERVAQADSKAFMAEEAKKSAAGSKKDKEAALFK